MISLLLAPTAAFTMRACTPPVSATGRAGSVCLMEGMGRGGDMGMGRGMGPMGGMGGMHMPEGNSGSSARGGVPDAMYGGMRGGMQGGMQGGMGGGMGGDRQPYATMDSNYGRYSQDQLGQYGGALRRGERRKPPEPG